MCLPTILVLLPLLVPQEDIPALVEKLGSPLIQEREDAVQRLRSRGEAALPALEKASRRSDREVALRARFILRAIQIRLKIPPAELASWTTIARTILNLHETITRQ